MSEEQAASSKSNDQLTALGVGARAGGAWVLQHPKWLVGLVTAGIAAFTGHAIGGRNSPGADDIAALRQEVAKQAVKTQECADNYKKCADAQSEIKGEIGLIRNDIGWMRREMEGRHKP